MSRGRYYKPRRGVTTKTLVLVLVLVLTVGCAVGGTVAWLTDSTAQVKNTFTTSDIEIDLTESQELDLQMIPGFTITKDPIVTVIKDSEECYLFVKAEKSQSFDSFMEYTMAEGWTPLSEGSDVFWRLVSSSTADQTFPVIKDNEVHVKDTVTKQMMTTLTAEPTLTFTAYAAQAKKSNDASFSALEAWAILNPST